MPMLSSSPQLLWFLSSCISNINLGRKENTEQNKCIQNGGFLPVPPRVHFYPDILNKIKQHDRLSFFFLKMNTNKENQSGENRLKEKKGGQGKRTKTLRFQG